MDKEEKIGKVKLNFAHYNGMDLYCDGEVEDELLDIVRNHKQEEYPAIIEKSASWPVLYHLSQQRSNIIEWIPMQHTEKVLEVGSGCGAITGALSHKAAGICSPAWPFPGSLPSSNSPALPRIDDRGRRA